jgi:hypothetical protein
MIAPARAVRVILHPAGRYVLLIRDEEALPPGPDLGQATTGGAALLLYDAVARRTRVLWEQPALRGTRRGVVADAVWLPGTDVIAAVVASEAADAPTPQGRQPTFSLLTADAARDSRARSVVSGSSMIFMSASPRSPVVAVYGERTTVPDAAGGGEWALRFLDARGRLGDSVIFPGRTGLGGWKADGTEAYAVTFERPPTARLGDSTIAAAPPRITRRWSSVNAATGQVTALSERPARAGMTPPGERNESPGTMPLRLSTRPMPVPGTDGKASPSALTSLWLEATATGGAPTVSPPLLLAPQVEESHLLPDLSAVIYVAQRAAYAVPLVRLSAAQFGAANTEALRLRTMQQAKQIGLAAMMYAQDYDGTMPPAGDVRSPLGPYLLNKGAFNDPVTNAPGFTYLLNGEKLSSIAAPATTPLGYLSGPDGRAVVYADGHVKWEPTALTR